MASLPKFVDWIKIYDDLEISDFCDRCLEFFLVYPNKNQYNADYRKCQEVRIPNSPLQEELKVILRKVFQQYKEETGNPNLGFVRKLESPAIFRYEVDPEKPNHFHRHADAWSMESASRQISIILYLNDVEEGGSTTFTDFDLKVHPKKGRILLFPSSFNFLHKGEPPVSGDKYIIVSWLHLHGNGHTYTVSDLY